MRRARASRPACPRAGCPAWWPSDRAGKMKAEHLVAMFVIAAGCSSAQPNHPAEPDAEDSTGPTPDAGSSAKADTAAPAPGDDAAIVVPADSAVSAPSDSAPPTSNGGAPAMAVETVEVSGDMVTMKTSLGMGEIFLLKAWG